jgi:hypothetical protein
MDAATKAHYLARMKELKTQYYIPSWVAKEIVTLEDIADNRPRAIVDAINDQLAQCGLPDGHWKATESRVAHVMQIADEIVKAPCYVKDFSLFSKQLRAAGCSPATLLAEWEEHTHNGPTTAAYIKSLLVAREGFEALYESRFLTNKDACSARTITKKRDCEMLADAEADDFQTTVDVLTTFFYTINRVCKHDPTQTVPRRAQPLMMLFRGLRENSDYSLEDGGDNDELRASEIHSSRHDSTENIDPACFETIIANCYAEFKNDWLDTARSTCISAEHIHNDARKDMIDNRLEIRRQVVMVAINTFGAEFLHYCAQDEGISLEQAIRNAVAAENADVRRCVCSEIKFLVRYISK